MNHSMFGYQQLSAALGCELLWHTKFEDLKKCPSLLCLGVYKIISWNCSNTELAVQIYAVYFIDQQNTDVQSIS